MPLPQPYMPDGKDAISAAASGYGMGGALQQRNLLRSAGALAAAGNLSGARDALYRGGQIDEAQQFQALIQQADARRLQQAKQLTDMLGGVALQADTPEKWATAMDAVARAGYNVDQYRDFGSRATVLAQAGLAKDAIEMEIKRRLADAKSQPATAYGSVANPTLARELAKRDAEMLEEARRAADTAEAGNQTLGRIESLRAQTDAEGTWRNNPLYRFVGRNIGGVDMLGIPSRRETAALDALAAEAVGIQLGFAERTKGAITEREMDLFGSATPGAQMTDQAAASVLRGMRAANLRTQARADFMDAWIRGYGTAEGASAAWAKFTQENPIIVGSDRDGNLIVDERNIANYDAYLQMGPQRRVGTDTRASAPANVPAAPRQRYINDEGVVIEWDGEKWVTVE